MSGEATRKQSIQPSPAAIALWLKQLNREVVHGSGWVSVNQRHHGLALSVRPFIQQHYTEEEQEAVFDGFTLALMTLAHFEDIEALSANLASKRL